MAIRRASPQVRRRRQRETHGGRNTCANFHDRAREDQPLICGTGSRERRRPTPRCTRPARANHARQRVSRNRSADGDNTDISPQLKSTRIDSMREFWVESEGVRLFTIEDGIGPVVIMLHGGMANHLAALPFIRPLGDRCRIVAPDLRGSGKSWFGASLTFDQLADDVELVLDYIGVDRAVVGGVSSGSGVALRFALRHPDRILGLVLVKPMYAGEARGYTEHQEETFALMDSVASRALAEGVQVLRQLYANLPDGMRERAIATMERFDPASVVATSRFVASGSPPFGQFPRIWLLLSVPRSWCVATIRRIRRRYRTSMLLVFASVRPCRRRRRTLLRSLGRSLIAACEPQPNMRWSRRAWCPVMVSPRCAAHRRR